MNSPVDRIGSFQDFISEMCTNIPTSVFQGSSVVGAVWHKTNKLSRNFYMDYWIRLTSIRMELVYLCESQGEGTYEVPQRRGVLREPDMNVLGSV